MKPKSTTVTIGKAASFAALATISCGTKQRNETMPGDVLQHGAETTHRVVIKQQLLERIARMACVRQLRNLERCQSAYGQLKHAFHKFVSVTEFSG